MIEGLKPSMSDAEPIQVSAEPIQLSELVAEKQLELTIPEQPKHPRQAYRASGRKECQP